MDQAEKLREMARVHRTPKINLPDRRIISVASGKGGVGKTNFSVNLAIALNQLEQQVMLLDADLGMANIDVVCGLSPKFNLGHVISGSRSFQDIVLDCFNGVSVIPGVSGVEDLTSLTVKQQQRFFDELEKFDALHTSKTLLIDIGAGMGPTVINFMLASSECIVITTPEPTAMMDAYALIKTIIGRKPEADIGVVVNMVRSKEEGLQVFHSMSMIAQQFLNHPLQYIGHLLTDPAVSKSVKTQSPFLLSHPGSPVSKCVREIALKLSNRQGPVQQEMSLRGIFERFSSFLGG